MADKKISALTGASTPLAGTEVLPIVQSGATVKATVANIVGAGTSPGSFTTIGGTGPVTIKQTSDYSSAGSGVNVVKSNTTDVWTTYVAADTAYSVAYGATLGASNRLWVYDTTGNLIPQTAAKGVNFTANTPAAGMTSQLLNKYEEGTWTPTYVSSGATFGYTQQKGSYVRIGNLVYAQFYLNVTASGTTTNQVTLTGLPFTSTTVNTPYEQGFGGAWSTNTQAVAFTINPGSTDANLWRQNTGPAVATADNVVGYQVGTLIYRAA